MTVAVGVGKWMAQRNTYHKRRKKNQQELTGRVRNGGGNQERFRSF